MKKRVIALMMCMAVIACSMSGCGTSSDEVQDVASVGESESVTEPESQMEEPETVEKPEAVNEAETADEQEGESEDAAEQDVVDNEFQETDYEYMHDGVFTADDAMQKLARLFNARNELYLLDDPAIYNLLIGAEHDNLGKKGFEMNVSTSDGISIDLKDGDNEETRINVIDLRIALIESYYYNYVNVEQKYYDLYEYVKSHTSDEILHGEHEYSWLCGAEDTNNIVMANVPLVLQYLFQNVDNITAGEIISGDDCTIEVVGEDVEYEVPILINGEYVGAKMLFDKEGNLLNIATINEEGWSSDRYIDSNGDKIDW